MTLELASVADLQAAVPGVSDELASSAIFRVSALVRRIARQSFDFVANDTVTLPGGNQDLVLPQGPVIVDVDHALTVVECSDLGVPVATVVAGQQFVRAGRVLSKRSRSMYSPGGLFADAWLVGPWPIGIWAPRVQVTYTHGFTEAPDWLTAIVVNAASVYATNPEGLYSLQVGGITQQWMRSTAQKGAEVVDQIKAELKAAGALPGGAFSIAAS